jgi:hypothetical protein
LSNGIWGYGINPESGRAAFAASRSRRVENSLPIYVYTHYEKGRQGSEPGLSLSGGIKKKPDFSRGK